MHPPPQRLILGCGYLGLRVARNWLESGSIVYAVTRTQDRAAKLAARGIKPLLADITNPHSLNELPNVKTLLWSVGFDRSGRSTHHDIHVRGLSNVLEAVPGTPQTIFCSSTGVWGDKGGAEVNEMTPTDPSRSAGHVLVEAEALLKKHRLGPGVSLRFAGLYGPDRVPSIANLKAGIPLAVDPESWLNLIHVDDAATVICATADANNPASLYVVSDGNPIKRREWYEQITSSMGIDPPSWDLTAPRSRGANKRVDASQLFRDFSLTLSHPDSLQAIHEIIQSERFSNRRETSRDER